MRLALTTCGIIPAYAGSTIHRRPHFRRRRDHPRIRGEHVPAVDPCCWGAGSSPHTRGAPSWRQLVAERCGIIPAYAGSTQYIVFSVTNLTDHPRIRGEHSPFSLPETMQTGSSPHTRGAPVGLALARKAPRIIPAYAGSTALFGDLHAGIPDHPRIRGEHRAGAVQAPQEAGSSPHTRGAP